MRGADARFPNQLSNEQMPERTDRRYWLLKSEPDCFSFDDLRAQPRQTTHWSGVRNYPEIGRAHV